MRKDKSVPGGFGGFTEFPGFHKIISSSLLTVLTSELQFSGVQLSGRFCELHRIIFSLVPAVLLSEMVSSDVQLSTGKRVNNMVLLEQ